MKTGAQGCKKKRRQRGDSVASHSCLMGDCREDREALPTGVHIRCEAMDLKHYKKYFNYKELSIITEYASAEKAFSRAVKSY